MITNPVDDFDGQAVLFKAPGCRVLPVLRAKDDLERNVFVSCWQFTWDQLREIIANDGKVYLHVWGSQPPVYVDHKNPMEK